MKATKIFLVSVFALLFFGVNMYSIEWHMSGGTQQAQTGGETICTYKNVWHSQRMENGVKVTYRVDCHGEGCLHCEYLIPPGDEIKGNLENDLIMEVQYNINDGVLSGSFNKNVTDGSTTYYGNIVWDTDSTGLTIANSSINVQ